MEFNEFIQRFNIKLNEQQKRAVLETEGALLLLAVPGSGKTTVIVSRIGYMIYCLGVPPEKILTLTFSVSATKDMKERFRAIFGEQFVNRLEFRTIHSFAVQILKLYENKYNKKVFKLLENSTQIVAQFCNGFSAGNRAILKEILNQISYCKNKMLDIEEIKKIKIEGVDFYKIYCAYEKYKLEYRLMDFDDQLMYANRILEIYPNILNEVKRKYQYVQVDEAQDTSKIQHKIIKKIVNENIFMVGDEDQCIYKFRAAYPQALLEFNKIYKNAKTLYMETNYRSTSTIIRLANEFIKLNKERKEKNMVPNQMLAKPIIHTRALTMEEQYNYLVKKVENCKGQIAILYRNNDSAIPLINQFQKKNIDFYIREQDTNFFDDKIIKDIKMIYEFSQDMTCFEIFEKIYFKLNCALRKDFLQDIKMISEKTKENIFDIILDNFKLPVWQAKKLINVKSELRSLRRGNAYFALQTIIENVEYRQFLESRTSEGSGTYCQKINVLYSIAKMEKTMGDFWIRLEQLEKLIKEGRSTYNRNVILSTIHASKGLEYENVVIIDVVDGILPKVANVKDFREEYYEEVRLFYVAMTRAKKELELITYNLDYNYVKQNNEFVNKIISLTKEVG